MISALTAENSLALAAATFVFGAIPGPGVSAVVSQALAHGLRPALLLGAGIIVGDMCYLLLAMLGLTWVAQQLGPAFVVLKWAGASYLVYLGARCLLAKAPAVDLVSLEAPTLHSASARNFLGGFLVSLSNPKVIAFYCGFLPGFVDMRALSYLDMACVAGIILPTGYSVVTMYAWLASQGRNVIGSGTLWRLAHGTAGAVMIGTGVAVAVN